MAQGAPSQGCQASNFNIDATLDSNGGGSWALTTPIPLSSYNVGETITLTFRSDNVGQPENAYGAYFDDEVARGRFNGGENDLSNGGPDGTIIGSVVLTYTITQEDIASPESFGFDVSYVTLVASCGDRADAGSSKLRTAQLNATRSSAQVSGAAISRSIEQQVGSRLPVAGGAQFTSQNSMSNSLKLGATDRDEGAYDRRRYATAVDSRMSTWGRVVGTGYDTDDQSDLRQVNLIGGIDYLVTNNFLIGVIGGYEDMRYDFDSLGARVDGSGETVGVYASWRFVPTLRADIAGAWSRLDYGASDDTASGSFDATRSMLSGGVTGGYSFGDYMFEPSVRAFVVWQDEEAWTDSAGSAYDKRDFTAGRVSVGSKLSRQLEPFNGWVTTPYVGLYADYLYSHDDAFTPGTAFLGLSEDWSARVTSGLELFSAAGHSVSFGSEMGGIGQEELIYTLTGRATLRF